MKKNTLPKLDFELLHRGAYRRLGGAVMLVSGILLVLAVTAHYVQIVQKIAGIETDANHSTHASDRGKPANTEETKAVQEGVAHLALPWGTLFSALENVHSEKITLVSVEPDAQKNTVKIVAEAPDVYKMLEYVRGLSHQAKLKEVLLAQYEVRFEDANQPVRFTLSASWGTVP